VMPVRTTNAARAALIERTRSCIMIASGRRIRGSTQNKREALAEV
jgi:hypothetical protein